MLTILVFTTLKVVDLLKFLQMEFIRRCW